MKTSSILPWVLALCVVVFSGCTSIRSTFVGRGLDGKYSPDLLGPKTCGVPVKLKVPTQIEVNIEEVFYINADGKVIFPKRRILEVAQPKKIYEFQMFTVDIVRPFSGSLNLTGDGQGYTLDDQQQITKLGATVSDKTISSITKILKGDTEELLGAKKQSVGLGNTDWHRQTRVIASRRFQIADPDHHEQMNHWIESYVKDCSDQCPTNCGCGVRTLVDTTGVMAPESPAYPQIDRTTGEAEKAPGFIQK